MKTLAGILMLLGAMVFMPTVGMATHEDDTADCELGDAPGNTVAVGDLYVNDRGDASIWLYFEDNGVDDLQTGGANPTQEAVGIGYTDSGHQELCGHESDILIF